MTFCPKHPPLFPGKTKIKPQKGFQQTNHLQKRYNFGLLFFVATKDCPLFLSHRNIQLDRNNGYKHEAKTFLFFRFKKRREKMSQKRINSKKKKRKMTMKELMLYL